MWGTVKTIKTMDDQKIQRILIFFVTHCDVKRFMYTIRPEYIYTEDEHGISLLYLACKNGSLDIVKELLRLGCDPNERGHQDGDVDMSRHCAANAGNGKIVKTLLEHGADTESRNMQGYAPLHLAAINDHVKVAKYLLEKNTDVNVKDIYGWTSLMLAAKNSKFKIAELLVKSKCTVDIQDSNRLSALMITVNLNDYKTTELLLKNGSFNKMMDKQSYVALVLAAKNNSHKMFKLLCNYHTRMDMCICISFYALLLAADMGYFDCMELLINGQLKELKDKQLLKYKDDKYVFTRLINSIQSNVSFFNCMPSLLTLAVHDNYEDLNKLFSKYVTIINIIRLCGTNVSDLIHSAIISGNETIVQLLIDHTADIRDDQGNSPLHLAAIHGDIKVARCLMKNKASLNAIDGHGRTPLMLVAINHQFEIARHLVKFNALLDIQDQNGMTALMIAADHYSCSTADIDCDYNTVEMILKNGASTDLVNKEGYTALIMAVKTKRLPIVEILLKHYADINMHDEIKGYTALMVSAEMGHFPIVELLLKYKANINIQSVSGWTALMVSAEKGNLTTVEMLLKHNADINMQDNFGRSALILSPIMKHLPIVERLLKHNTDINMNDNDGLSALIGSAKMGCLPIVELLLKHSADINMQDNIGQSSLIVSAIEGHLPILELLLKHNACINMQDNIGKSALIHSATNGHLPIVEMLLKHNVNINMQDKEGWSALIVSAANEHLQIVELLLKHNADINMQDNIGKSALIVSAIEGHLPIAELLLKHNADINMQDHNGKSALIGLAANGHLPIVELLLKHKADINMQDNNGMSALIGSAANGYLPIAELFLKHNADINMQDNNGRSALIWSAANGHLPIVELLLKHNADINMQDNNGISALIGSAANGYLPIAELFLKHNADINMQSDSGLTALIISVLRGYNLITRILLEHNADIGNYNIKHNKNALTIAINTGQTTAIRIILKHMISQHIFMVNSKDVTSLVLEHCADIDIQDICHHFVMASLERGVHISTQNASFTGGGTKVATQCNVNMNNNFALSLIDGKSPLHWAIDRKLMNFVRVLLHRCVDINEQDGEGWSVLFTAVKNNDTMLTQLLLDHNVTVDIEAKDGTSPISICKDHGHQDILTMLVKYSTSFDLYTALLDDNINKIKYLIKQGCDLNQVFSKERSTLHVACANNHSPIVAMLLDQNVCPHRRDLWGRTPLHEAAWYGNERIIQLLLPHYPPTINLYDINGWTPLHIAARESSYTCTQILMNVHHIRSTQSSSDAQGYTAMDYAHMGRRRYHKEEGSREDMIGNLKVSQPDDKLIQLFKPQQSPLNDYTKHHVFSARLLKAVSIVEMVRQDNMCIYDIWTLLTVDGLGLLRQKTTACNIKKIVTKFLHKMVTKMQSLAHSLFSYEIGGSTVENTKTGLPDEFDCQINLEGLENCVNVGEEMEHNLILKLLSCDDENVKHWIFESSDDAQLKSDMLYDYIYKLMCTVLADRNIYTGLPLLWKYIDNEQIHLELQDTNLPGLAIKIDVVFVIRLPKWFPKKGRTSTPLLNHDFIKLGACILLKGKTWKSSTSIQEGIFMKSLPMIPKCAYILAKIINSIMVYSREDVPYRVRSFDLKNALMYEVHAFLDNMDDGPITLEEYKNEYHDGGELGQIEYTDPLDTFTYSLDEDEEGFLQGSIIVKDCKVDIYTLKQITRWTHRLCEQGLKRLLPSGGGQPYYFGMSQSRMTEHVVKKFLNMVDIVLQK